METDIPPLSVSNERWQEILNNLPMTLEERSSGLSGYEISEDQMNQLLSRN